MSYIEIDTVLNLITDIMQDCEVVHKHRALNRNIKRIPTADVVEVRHGYWRYNRHQAPTEKSYFCSLCAEGESDYGKDKYCNCCGAKMDGERKENGT